MNTYQLTSHLQRTETNVLAIHCGDFRFQAAFHEFLASGLNLKENYDLLVIPGGPMSLTLFEYLPKFSWASWKWFRFFVEQHKIRRLILIQHQDCAWYKSMPVHLHASSDLRERQEQDLGRVGAVLKKEFPALATECYYAGWDSTEQINIVTIPT